MIKKQLVIGIAALLSSACAAVERQGFGLSQSRYGPRAGNALITASGSFRDSSTETAGSTLKTARTEIGAGYGYFLTDTHEVGVQVALSVVDSNTPDDQTSLSATPYYNWNHRFSGQTWFYGGVRAGLRHTESDSATLSDDLDSLEWGLQVGWRQWLTTKAAFFVEPRYTRYEVDVAGTKRDTGEFGTYFGFAIQL